MSEQGLKGVQPNVTVLSDEQDNSGTQVRQQKQDLLGNSAIQEQQNTSINMSPKSTNQAQGLNNGLGNTNHQTQGFEYQVITGDTLWELATIYLGSGFQWQDIYQANVGIIGSNPEQISAGLIL